MKEGQKLPQCVPEIISKGWNAFSLCHDCCAQPRFMVVRIQLGLKPTNSFSGSKISEVVLMDDSGTEVEQPQVLNTDISCVFWPEN